MQCPNCYSSIAAGSRTCPRCDYSLAGGTLSEGAKFEYNGAEQAAAPWAGRATQQPSWNNNEELTWPAQNPEGVELTQFNWNDTRQVVAAPQNQGVERIQLTSTQRKTLRFKGSVTALMGFLPIAFMAFFIFQMRGFRISFEESWFGVLFALSFIAIPVLIIVISLKSSLAMFADAKEAIALRQTDLLEKKHRVRSNNSTRYYGYFSNIGKLSLSPTQYRNTAKDMVYQVTYSPRSKYIWAIEALYPAFQQDQH